MPSLRNNILYNSIRIGSNLLFPIITFPYVTRIMGPNSLGLFNYIFAIAGYFTLFASLGFPIYGVREVAKSKNDITRLQSVTNAIFTANTIACLFVYIIYLITSLFLIHSAQEFWLYFVIGLSILFSCISFDWFFQGIEDFKYITIRSIVIKIISIICLFIFVRSKEDLLAYAILTIAGTCGNNILNILRINQYIKLRFSLKDCWKHTKGASVLFLGTIAISLYTNLNSIMVGALGTMSAVAYFTIGNRLIQMLITILGAIISSIIPRMSYFTENGNKLEITSLQKKTINLLLYISIPMTLGIITLAKPLILLFGGKEFIPSIPVMQILSPIIIIISLSAFLANQILLPLHKEKYGNYCVGGGSVTNLFLNILLIPLFDEIGVSISVVISEIVVTSMYFYFSKNHMNLSLKDFIPIKCILAATIMFVVLFYLSHFEYPPLYCIIWAIIGFVIYVLCLHIFRDKFLNEIVLRLTK